MDLLARIQHHFATSIATQQQALAVVSPDIVLATERLAHCLSYESKVLVCGHSPYSGSSHPGHTLPV